MGAFFLTGVAFLVIACGNIEDPDYVGTDLELADNIEFNLTLLVMLLNMLLEALSVEESFIATKLLLKEEFVHLAYCGY